jgi:membrane protein DedA with SNARE-associated domain
MDLSEILDQLSEIITDVIDAMGYVGIALIMLIENLFPPIPSELVMPFAGFLVAEGRFSFVGVVAAGTVGAVLGALALYWLGAWAGEPLVRQFLRRYGRFVGVSEQELDQSLAAFGKRGEIMVFAGRLIPLIRSLISIPAGMNHMPMGRFLLFTTLGSAIWNIALTYAGYVLGQNWESVLDFISQYQRATLVVLGLLFALWVGRKLLQWRNRQTQTSTVSKIE